MEEEMGDELIQRWSNHAGIVGLAQLVGVYFLILGFIFFIGFVVRELESKWRKP
jgi:hypothetical protein